VVNKRLQNARVGQSKCNPVITLRLRPYGSTICLLDIPARRRRSRCLLQPDVQPPKVELSSGKRRSIDVISGAEHFQVSFNELSTVKEPTLSVILAVRT